MIFLRLNYNQFISLLLRGVNTTFFSDSFIPMQFKSSANGIYLETDGLLPSLDFILSHIRRNIILSAYIAIAVG